jgi:hypothetical protein
MGRKSISLTVLLSVIFLFSVAAAYESLSGPTQLIQYKAAKTYEGYTLITSMNGDKTYLIDMLGYVVHTWEHKTKPPGLHFVLLENGHILGNIGTGMMQGPPGAGPQKRAENSGRPAAKENSGKPSYGGAAAGLIELDWDGNVVWKFEPGSSDGTVHHDFIRLPNGNTLCNAWEVISYKDAIAGGRRADQTTEKGVATDVIYEVNPEGKIVWKWSAWEHRGMNSKAHLDVNYITYVLPEHAENNPDWTHFNTVDYDAATDRILVDSREFGELYIIDHKTGNILYRWGNPSAYGAGKEPTFTTPGEQILFGPHDARWIKAGLPGAGHILIFNNGWARPPINYSSVIEMDPDTGKIVWEYKSGSPTSFYSDHISNAQRLPNGNTMICSGLSGHIFEVTPEKEVVWEYINPLIGKTATNWLEDGSREKNNGMFRAHRYGPDYPGLKGKDLKPRGQIADDVKGAWKPRVDLTGATQQGAKLWEQIWK